MQPCRQLLQPSWLSDWRGLLLFYQVWLQADVQQGQHCVAVAAVAASAGCPALLLLTCLPVTRRALSTLIRVQCWTEIMLNGTKVLFAD